MTQSQDNVQHRPPLDLLAQLREDLAVYDSWTRPGFQALALYRIGVWRKSQHALVRRPVGAVQRCLELVIRNVYGIELPVDATIGRRLCIAHSGSVHIHADAVLGDDCRLRKNVTIGSVSDHSVGAPRLGDRVDVGVGAVVIGNIAVGNDARIGPNAIVTTSVPDGAMAVAAPARVLTSLPKAAPLPEQPSDG